MKIFHIYLDFNLCNINNALRLMQDIEQNIIKLRLKDL